MDNKPLKITIVILTILLLIASLSYTGVVLYNNYKEKESIIEKKEDVEPQKIIDETPEVKQTEENENKKEIKEETKEEQEIPEEIIDESLLIKLYKHHKDDNTKFYLDNMFPGDIETKYYCVRVSYKDKIVLRFNATFNSEDDYLNEVTNIKIKLLNTNEVLYEGLIKDIPQELTYKTKTNRYTTEDFYYEITVSLDKTAGNEYQDKTIKGNFKWFVEEDNLVPSPDTGDYITYWVFGAILSLIVITLIIIFNKRKQNTEKLPKKIVVGIVTIFVLIFSLLIASYVFAKEVVGVNNNYFHTGRIKVNLNDGKPVITEDEFLFEPGMTVEKDFFVENVGTWDVFYKLYLKDVEGSLKDVLQITIKDNDGVLYYGTANELNKENVSTVNKELKVNERHNFKIIFHYPETSGNETKNSDVTFSLAIDVVQTKNNTDKEFE